jgi:hypothetical protein
MISIECDQEKWINNLTSLYELASTNMGRKKNERECKRNKNKEGRLHEADSTASKGVITTGISEFPECQENSAKAVSHSAESLPSVVLS